MKKIIFFMSILAASLCSCESWFDVPPKETYMNEKELFGHESVFRNAMNGIYTQLRTDEVYGAALSLGGVEFLGQTFIPDSEIKPMADFDYTDGNVRERILQVWEKMYGAIHSCNNLLRIFEQRTDVNFIPGSRQMMMAELKALRAFIHFELIRLFHPAASVDGGFKGISWIDDNDRTPRILTTNELLDLIESELSAAIVELQPYDPLITGVSYDRDELFGTTATGRVLKMNYLAALGVKARVCMARGTTAGYTEARKCVDEVINSGKVLFITSVGSDFAFSKEHLWGLASSNYAPNDAATYRGICYWSELLFVSRAIEISPATDMQGWKSSSPNDIRLRWFDIALESMQPKFGPASTVADLGTMQRIPMIKLGEMFLIGAEAALGLDNREAAYNYMNTFAEKRFRATPLTENSTKEEFETEILSEYLKEFLGEGQLFHYYKRKNLPSIAGYNGKSVTMSTAKYNWPIPQYASQNN